ncbi:MAG TPA: PqqD family protein [Methylomirabilota bacterium]|jgi:hypothetical protein|nr:PqqD family protein [Methylomirabilota bacterium]
MMSTRFAANPETVATRVGDEIVVVHLGTDRIYVLNRTAARVWELVCEDGDRAEIERRMLGEFAVERDQLSGQVGELLASLADNGLIVGST